MQKPTEKPLKVYLRSLDTHTWKGRSTCESSDLATLVTVGWVASLVRVADDHRPVDGGKGDLLPDSTLINSFRLCSTIVIIHVCHTLCMPYPLRQTLNYSPSHFDAYAIWCLQINSHRINSTCTKST